MVSDRQLASAITGVVRVVGWSQDAVLGEIAQSPVIDQRAVDAASRALLGRPWPAGRIRSRRCRAQGAEGNSRDRMRELHAAPRMSPTGWTPSPTLRETSRNP